MLSAFNLLEKRDAFSKSLSGGMKRKLSIIIALLGDSKVKLNETKNWSSLYTANGLKNQLTQI